MCRLFKCSPQSQILSCSSVKLILSQQTSKSRAINNSDSGADTLDICKSDNRCREGQEVESGRRVPGRWCWFGGEGWGWGVGGGGGCLRLHHFPNYTSKCWHPLERFSPMGVHEISVQILPKLFLNKLFCVFLLMHILCTFVNLSRLILHVNLWLIIWGLLACI